VSHHKLLKKVGLHVSDRLNLISQSIYYIKLAITQLINYSFKFILRPEAFGKQHEEILLNISRNRK